MPESPRSGPADQAQPGPFPRGERATLWAVTRIVLLYAGFAILWILLSDRGVSLLFRDPATAMAVSSVKGVVFVLFTSALLFTTLHRYVRGLAASEQKFSMIFQMSPDAVDLTHLETGLLVELNRSYLTMFGYSREELLDRSTLPSGVGIWVRAGDRERHVAELKRRGIVLGWEAELRRKDGSILVAEICSSLLEIKGERYNLSMARDITAQKRAEEALRESGQRLELASAAAALGIWDRNLVLDTEVWNGRLFEMYGLEPRPEPPGYDEWRRTIVHPEDREAAEAAVQAALDGRRGYDLQFRVVLPDGAVRHIKSDAQVLRDGSGRAVRIIGVNQDQTRQVEAEARQRRLQAELQHAEKLESIGSLAGGVAHDMNNVLAAIMGMASSMRSEVPEGEPQARALDTITRACARGRDVVKSLLYFARKDLESAGPVDLNAIAREMVQLLSYTTLKRIQISTDFQEPLGLIEGDGGALGHALINLCVNAVDAMPAGGTLELRTRSGPGGVTLSVRDSGEGMGPEVVRRSIEPFFTTKPVGKGTGLGLAMVYGTVQAHRGSFEIRSEPGQGTEVVLGFPLLPETPRPAAPEPAAGAAMGPVRILLVDDDELIRMSIGPMIETLGHRVHTAESGLEALARIQAGLEVDLVILDMNMPGLNGAQTLTRLLELRPDQTVLMATGYSDDSIAPLLAGRANVFSLRKPFTRKEFQTKLESMGRFSGR